MKVDIIKLGCGEMPRQARIISDTGIYHIMTRGINKEQIFKKEIKKRILEIIKISAGDADLSEKF